MRQSGYTIGKARVTEVLPCPRLFQGWTHILNLRSFGLRSTPA